MIYDNYISLFIRGIKSLNIFIFFVDRANEFQGDLILKVDSEVCKEEYTFLYYFDVCLQNKVSFNSGIYKL